jgi:hypothetical protein
MCKLNNLSHRDSLCRFKQSSCHAGGAVGSRAGGAVDYMITMPNLLGKDKKILQGGLVKKESFGNYAAKSSRQPRNGQYLNHEGQDIDQSNDKDEKMTFLKKVESRL